MTTSRALRNSRQISSTPRALPPRSLLTTLKISAPEIREPAAEFPGPAPSWEGPFMGLRRFSKFSFYWSSTSQVDVSSTPCPPCTVLTVHFLPPNRKKGEEWDKQQRQCLPSPWVDIWNRHPIHLVHTWKTVSHKLPIGFFLIMQIGESNECGKQHPPGCATSQSCFICVHLLMSK